MLTRLHHSKKTQLLLGLAAGFAFGFLLEKGGATRYDVIVGQLLLADFTVLKIMLSAAAAGMLGVHLLGNLGLAQLHPKPGSWGATAVGGLIFGLGFATLGYCPGTIAAAVGQGWLDALAGGLTGIILGAWIFASLYPRLKPGILSRGAFKNRTFPELFKVNPWAVIIPAVAVIAAFLYWLESRGL